MRTDVNLILMALDAHSKMINAIFGSGEEPTDQSAPKRGATVEQYLSLSKRINSRYQKPKRQRPAPPAKAKGGGRRD